MRKFALVLLFITPAWSQKPVTLQQAVNEALSNHGSIRAASAATKSAAVKISELRGALLPRVSYSESWQRSNNQVFVFGSLLTQKQFTATNFAVDSLNSPPFLNNFQSQLVTDQTVYDNGLRRSRLRTAELGRGLADEDVRRTESEVIADVLRAYFTALLSMENSRVAREAARSAEADLSQAEDRRAVGLTTDADTLSVKVHLAAMREREIRSAADVEIALAALNHAMGIPLDTRLELTSPLAPFEGPEPERAGIETEAMGRRPELRQARLAIQIAEANAKSARAALLPEFYVRGVFEADRQRLVTRGGANWLAMGGLRWNLFDGFADRARLEAARHESERAHAQARVIESGARLEVRRALQDHQSARQRIRVSNAAVEMARESLRITKDRYEAGLDDVTRLLRSEVALLEAQMRELEAIRDQRMAAIALELAQGKLSRDSDVVRR